MCVLQSGALTATVFNNTYYGTTIYKFTSPFSRDEVLDSTNSITALTCFRYLRLTGDPTIDLACVNEVRSPTLSISLILYLVFLYLCFYRETFASLRWFAASRVLLQRDRVDCGHNSAEYN